MPVSSQIIWRTFLRAIWRDPSASVCAPDASGCDGAWAVKLEIVAR